MAESKKYYWLKLKTDFFGNRAMKKLRRIAGGDTYTIIYLKLQLLSITEEGRLYYEGIEDTFYEEMALALDEDVDNVKATLLFLENCGLITKESDDEYLLTEVPDIIGSETDSAERMRKHRAEKKKIEAKNGPKPSLCDNDVRTSDEDVRNCYTEKRRERDRDREEIEIETEIEKNKSENDAKAVVDLYHETCVSFPRVRSLSQNRIKAIKARFRSGRTLEDFKEVFYKAEMSSFLKGANNRNWSATFDWMIEDRNMSKVLDGNYDDNRSPLEGVKSPGRVSTMDEFTEMTKRWLERSKNDEQD